MDALYLTVIGVILAVMFTLVGAWWKAKEEARGWKVSYEREKETNDRRSRIEERSELATEISTKTAEAIQELIRRATSGGGVS